ncbi:S9 family peptidase, partial [Roseateles sp. P5_E11]
MQLKDTSLLTRAVLFGNPERGGCQVSPCGTWIAFVAPQDGVMNLWVTERGQDAAASFNSARCITRDRARGIYNFSWSHDGTHLLYLQDANGDENDHVFAVAAAGGEARDLTPFPGVRASVQALSLKHPGKVLVTLNKRDPRFADLYVVELGSGELTLVRENPRFYGFVTDDDYQVKLAIAPKPDGGRTLLKPAGDDWVAYLETAAEDAANSHPVGLNADGHTLYMLDSSGRDTAALVSIDLRQEAATPRLIAQHPQGDINGIWAHPRSHAPLAWIATIERREVHVLDASLQNDLAYLDAQGLGEWGLTTQTLDETVWVVRAARDMNPATYYLYERARAKLTKLYDAVPSLVDAPLARMQSTKITSRDGLDMVSYLTLPVHVDRPNHPLASSQPVPLVLFVHGGPRERDRWGYNPYHQWLANRGYAVLSVNYRSSTGFGKAYIRA